MTKKWYRIPSRGSGGRLREVMVGDDKIAAFPASSDVPSGFWVDTDAREIRLEFSYHSGDREPRVTHTLGSVTVHVGEHSKRLFALVIDTRAFARDLKRAIASGELGSAYREFAAELTKELGSLQRRTQLAGPRMNYEMAEQGLDLDEDTPPAWLIDAMSRGDEGRSSRP